MSMKVKLTRPLKTDGCHMSYLVLNYRIFSTTQNTLVSLKWKLLRGLVNLVNIPPHLIIMRQALSLRGEAASKDDFVTFLQHNSWPPAFLSNNFSLERHNIRFPKRQLSLLLPTARKEWLYTSNKKLLQFWNKIIIFKILKIYSIKNMLQ